MKKMRKGFTLVELLIVIAIVGALATAMSMSGSKATGAAKAATLINNIEICKTAAALYYAANSESDLSTISAKTFLESQDYIPNFAKMSTGTITISEDNAGKGYKGWTIKVDFTKDGASKDISISMLNAKAYSGDSKVKNGQFNVTLWNGKVAEYK